MESQVCQFIDRVANSLVRLEVVLFFNLNPSTTESPEGIAWRIYREVDHIREAMEHLARCGVLEEFNLPGGSYRLYSLTEDPNTLETIGRLADYYYNDAERRIEIVRRLVTGAPQRTLPSEPPDSPAGPAPGDSRQAGGKGSKASFLGDER